MGPTVNPAGKAKMPTLAAGNKRRGWPRTVALGFTLIELMVVLAIIAIATAGVSLSLRDSAKALCNAMPSA